MSTTANRAHDAARRQALTAGLALLAMTVLGPVGLVFGLQNVLVPGDAAATVANLTASEGTFRLGAAAFLVVAVLDVVVAWALGRLFDPVDAGLSTLTAWFRVAYAAVFVGTITRLTHAAALLEDAGAEGAASVEALAAASVAAFRDGWTVGLAVFGVHLLLLGVLLLRALPVPRWIGALVLIAAAGYLVDGFGTVLRPGYDLNVGTYTFVGEVVLMAWLVWNGVRGFAAAPGPRARA